MIIVLLILNISKDKEIYVPSHGKDVVDVLVSRDKS